MSDSTFSGKQHSSQVSYSATETIPTLGTPLNPLPSVVPMSDQEIRARALECAVHRIVNLPGANIWELVEKFEAYIRDGR